VNLYQEIDTSSGQDLKKTFHGSERKQTSCQLKAPGWLYNQGQKSIQGLVSHWIVERNMPS